MKLTLLILLLTGLTVMAQNSVSMEQQSNIEAETQIVEAGKELAKARSEVIKTIEEIKDQKKKELYRGLFEKNERAWSDFIDSTALLQQPIRTIPAEPDIRYTRILGTDYSGFRLKQYREFVIWLKQKTEG